MLDVDVAPPFLTAAQTPPSLLLAVAFPPQNIVTLFRSLVPESAAVRPREVIKKPSVPTFISDPSVRIVNPDDPNYFMADVDAGVQVVEEVSAFSTKGVMKMFESDGEDLGSYNARRR